MMRETNINSAKEKALRIAIILEEAEVEAEQEASPLEDFPHQRKACPSEAAEKTQMWFLFWDTLCSP